MPKRRLRTSAYGVPDADIPEMSVRDFRRARPKHVLPQMFVRDENDRQIALIKGRLAEFKAGGETVPHQDVKRVRRALKSRHIPRGRG